MTVTYHGQARPSESPAARYRNNSLLSLMVESGTHNVRRHWRRHIVRVSVLVLADILAYAGVSALLLWVIGGGLGPSVATLVGARVPAHVLLTPSFGVAVLIGLIFSDAYRPGEYRRDGLRIIGGVALACGLTMYGLVWSEGFVVGAGQVVWTGLFFVAGLSLERRGVDWVVDRVGPLEPSRVIVVGDSELEDRVFGERGIHLNTRQIEIVGCVGLHDDGGEPVGEPIEALGEVIHTTGADTVIVRRPLDHEDFDHVVDQALTSGCRLLAGSRAAGASGVEPRLVRFYDETLVEMTAPHLRGWELVIKRGIDIMVAVAGIVLLAPLWLLIAAAVKLSSPGPVFFRQERVGFGCRIFKMVKFRTMRVGADAEKEQLAHLNQTGDARLFKIPNDPRVTRVGALLRRWSLDELPQLWNVLMGDMSLVGPRPFFENDLEDYKDHHFIRLCARPGITGLWQVNGRSSVLDFEEVVQMDREYVKRWSLWLDIRILLQTLPAVVRKTGAF